MIDRLPLASAPALILVVDDEPKNIQVVGALLLKHGHEVIGANGGIEALEKLTVSKPDLILLDVMMPTMTGFELCRILRDDPETRPIPVIFLSAATDKSFVVEALEHGGVDYVTKPFHGPELMSRINLQLNLLRTRRRLNDLIGEKNRLLEIVAHDLKNPLSGIQFAATMLAESNTDPDRQRKLVESISTSTTRAFEIIATLLETRGMDEVKSQLKREPVALGDTAARALKGFEQHLRSKNIRLDLREQQSNVVVLGQDATLLCCLENLISNAIKFSPHGANIVIHVDSTNGSGEFRIEDQGPGIQQEEVDGLFRKFSRLSARPTAGEGSTGLGLHIVHELMGAMEGSVAYEDSSLLGGACFSVRLPLARD